MSVHLQRPDTRLCRTPPKLQADLWERQILSDLLDGLFGQERSLGVQTVVIRRCELVALQWVAAAAIAL